jgi:hypothetical protein
MKFLHSSLKTLTNSEDFLSWLLFSVIGRFSLLYVNVNLSVQNNFKNHMQLSEQHLESQAAI